MKKDINKKLIIGFSIGDYNGIGPEILLKSFLNNKLFKKCIPIVFCDYEILNYYKSLYNYQLNIKKCLSIKNKLENNTIYTLISNKINYIINTGIIDANAGLYSINSLKEVINSLKNKSIDGLVTLPINKINSQSEKFKFPGHTEYLQNIFDVRDTIMIMHSKEMTIGFITSHIPLRKVNSSINSKHIQSKILTFISSLETDFNINNPRIAVLGLNPHCGESGLLGNEEVKIIIPTINKLNNINKNLHGPFPADSFFGMKKYKNFDGIISFYHDQGLIGFKSASFQNGVNYTAGLPYVRTSPDHGTAFEISGKNKANEISLTESIYLNIEIINNRKFSKLG